MRARQSGSSRPARAIEITPESFYQTVVD